jgi:hypothetical protein
MSFNPIRRMFEKKKETREDYLKFFSDPPRNFTEAIPSLQPPLPRYAPELLAARWTAHDLRCEDWPAHAADLLAGGYDTPSLRVLAGEMHVASAAEIESLVCQVLRELHVPYPIPEITAVRLMAREIARAALAGQKNAWRAARELAFLSRIAGWEDRLLNGVGQCIDAIDVNPKWRPSAEKLDFDLIDLLTEIAKRDNALGCRFHPVSAPPSDARDLEEAPGKPGAPS